jgi:hypothetical protein
MSTKSSVYYSHDGDTHVYEECFEDNVLYVDQDRDTVQLSLAAALAVGEWAVRTANHLRKMAALTDWQIRDRAGRDVDERIKRYEESKGKPKGSPAHFLAMSGCMVYGDAGDPREQQIASGIEHWREARMIAQTEMAELEAERKEIT